MHMNTVKEENKDFLIEQYFLGRTTGYGTMHDFLGRLIAEVEIEMSGYWEKDIFILDEIFIFKSSKEQKRQEQKRQWKIVKESKYQYCATSNDLLKKASGIRKENTMNWKYQLLINYRNKEIAFDFDDWIYNSGDIVINKVKMKKFGIKLAELFISYKKPPKS